MSNCVCYYNECHVREGKILFPWFLKCEKKVELSGPEAKTLLVIYNLYGDGPPSVDTLSGTVNEGRARIRYAERRATRRKHER